MVRRSLNWKALVGTVIVGAAAATGLHQLHAFQIRQTAEALLVLATAEEANTEWAKAAGHLDRYLRLRPEDAATRVRLAFAFGRGATTYRDRQRAIELFYRALALGQKKDELDLRRRVAELLLQNRRFTEAEREAALACGASANDSQANRTLALSLVAQLVNGSLIGKPLQEAKVLHRTELARELNPQDIELAEAQALVYRNYPQVVQLECADLTAPDRQRRADDAIDRLVQDNPQLAAAHLARHQYRIQYRLPGAAADLDAALRLAPDDVEVLLSAALDASNRADRLGNSGEDPGAVHTLLEQSKGYFEQLVGRQDLVTPVAHLGLGDVWLRLNEPDKAIEVWLIGHKQFTQPTSLVLFYARIADVLIDRDRLSEAADWLDKIEQVIGKLGTSVAREQKLELTRSQDLRRATWLIKRANVSAALPLLQQVIVTQPQGGASIDASVRAYWLLGGIFSSLGEWQEAAAAWDQAASLQPSLQAARLAAARAWLVAGRAELSSERAEQALGIASTFEAWLALAAAQLQYQTSVPSKDRSWSRLEEALSMLEKAPAQRESKPWRVEVLRAEYHAARAKATGEPDDGVRQATDTLKTAESKYFTEKDFWAQVCFTYQQIGLTGDAERALARFRETGGSAIEVAVASARLSTLRGDPARAKAVLQKAVASAGGSEQDRLRTELLQVLVTAKELKPARLMLLQEHRRAPQNVSLIRRLAEIDLEERNWKGVEEWEQKLTAIGGTGAPLAGYYRAWRLYLTAAEKDGSRLSESLRELEQVILLRPNWPAPATLKGMIEQRLGRVNEAIADFERAVQLGERRLFVFEQLISLLDQANRSADVDRYLARLEADMPLTQRLAELASSQEIRRERHEQAVEIARQNAAARPGDAAAQLWLGRMLMIAGQNQEAEGVLKKLIQDAPADARGWNALLALYSRSNRRDALEQALTALTQADQLEKAQKTLLVAQVREALGQSEEAGRSFAEAALLARHDLAAQLRVAQYYLKRDPAQAQPYLEAALKIDSKSVAARRMLALALALQGEMAKAEPLLASTDSSTAATEDVRLHVLLLAQQGDVASLKRAVSLLEGLVSGAASAQPNDRLLLAQLYERQARTTDGILEQEQLLRQAEQQLLSLAELPDTAPLHFAALVQFFGRHPECGSAVDWLQKLEDRIAQMANPDGDVPAMLIRLQSQHGAPDRSKPYLEKLAKVDSPLRLVALQAQVEISGNPDADVESLIEPMARRLIEESKGPQERAQLFADLGALYTALNRPAAAERWYRRLAETDGKSFGLVISALAKQGRLMEAIELCEQLMSNEKTPDMAIQLATALIAGSPTSDHFQRAESVLRESLERFGSDVRLTYAMALVRTVQGKNAEAIALFRKTLEANPRFVPALNNLAMMLAEIPTEREEALWLIDRAIEISGRESGLLDSKGAILLLCGRSADAIPLLESATRDPKADPRHHFHLAVAYRDQGKLEDAEAQLKVAFDRELTSKVLTSSEQKQLQDLRAALQL